MQIEDGKGTGNKAEVTSNKLEVIAVTVTEDHHANHASEDSYNIIFSQSPTAGDDCIYYMVNSDENDMIVEGMTLGFTGSAEVDAEVYVQVKNTGTRGSATALTPANLNAGSGKTATGTFEKGADLQSGAGSLATGTEIERFLISGVTDFTSTHFNFNQDVIITKNQTMTIWASEAGPTYYITLPFYYHGKN